MNPKPNVIVFSPFYPPHIGGLETHADEFNRHLAARGYTITVFTPRLPHDAPATETRFPGVHIIRFPAWEPIHNYPLPTFWPFWSSFGFFRLFRALLDEKPDLVIARTRFFVTSLLAVVYARRKHVPLVHIEHGSDFAQFNRPIKTALGTLYDWLFGRFVLRSADIVIGNSHASAAFVRKLSGRTDCRVIYRGVEIEKIANILSDQSDTSNKMMITYIGRLIDGKGVIDLLEALTHLDRLTFHCHIVGTGPEWKRLQTFARENHLEHNITFHGHQPFERSIALLKASDIVVNPSYTEGIPTSVIEAALCEKAIIATDVGGTKEIITGKNDGFLIPPKRPDILAEKLEILMNNKELRSQYAEAAHTSVHNTFSWDKAIEQYLEVFSELLDNRK